MGFRLSERRLTAMRSGQRRLPEAAGAALEELRRWRGSRASRGSRVGLR